MRRRRWRERHTGFGAFLLGTGMGLITNLVTGEPERWPRVLQPIAAYAPLIGLSLLAAVGARAAWDVWQGGVVRPEWVGGNPYPGLVPYTEGMAGVFFGRSSEIADLLTRVRDARGVIGRFVPVVGPSGSGKSSLVLAGLVPALRQAPALRVLPAFTPGTDPLFELGTVLGVDVSGSAAAALAAAREGVTIARLNDVLAALARLRAGARGLVLIVDQLEETVTQGVAEDRQAFLALIEVMLTQDPRLRVVATVRSDTIGAFQQGPGRDLFHAPLMVNVMGSREIRLVVREPARLTGTTFDDGLADEIIGDAGGGDALPLLSFLLSDLYRSAAPDRHLSWRQYESSGGVSGAITRQADAAVAELGPDALDFCLETLLRFVTLGAGGATRQSVPASVLDPRQEAVVRAFVDARLLISDRAAAQETVYDIAHEALLRQWPPLRDYIARHEESLRQITELAPLARAWQRARRHPDYLITGGRLRDAVAWASGGRAIPAEVREFLEESQRNQAGELERRATQAARESLSEVLTAPETALALALGAYTDLAPTELARYALEVALALGLVRVVAHQRGVRSVAIGADGRMATAAAFRVSVWAADGTLLHTLDHPEGANGVAFGSTGRLATVAGATLRLWEPDGTLAATWWAPGPLSAAAFTSDGCVVVAALDGSVHRLDAGLAPLEPLRGRRGAAYALAVAADGRVAVGLSDGTVLVWNGDGGPERVLRDAADCVFALAFGPDGSLAAGTRGATVTVWNAAGVPTDRRAGHRDAVHAVAFGSDGRLVSAAADGGVRVWAPGGRLIHALPDTGEPVSAVAFGPDGLLAVASADSTVRLWDLDARLVITVLAGDAVTAVFTPPGQLIVGGPQVIRRWVPDGDALDALPGPATPVLAVSTHGELAGGYSDGTVRVAPVDVWPVDGLASASALSVHGAAVTALAYGHDGQLLCAAADGGVAVVRPGDGSVEPLPGVHRPVTGIVAGPNGTFITCRADGLVCAWDGTSPSAQVLDSGEAVAATAGGGLIVGQRDGSVLLYDATGQAVHRLSGHAGPVTAIAVAGDGRFATAGADGEVRLWQPDGQLLHRAAAGRKPITSIAFAPDGRLAIVGAGVVWIWPYGTPPARLVGLAGRYPSKAPTDREGEVAMPSPLSGAGR